MSESIKLNLGFARINFEFELENGDRVFAILREMNGSDRNKYMEWAEGLVKRNDSGDVVGMRSFKDSQTFVLSLCLYKAELDDTGRPVELHGNWKIGKAFDKGELAQWPDHALQTLSAKAMEISRLTETSDEVGND